MASRRACGTYGAGVRARLVVVRRADRQVVFADHPVAGDERIAEEVVACRPEPENVQLAWVTQASSGVSGSPANNDFFGNALVAGDFDGDGEDDLAISATNDDEAGTNAGSVTVLYGSPSGLTATGSDFLTSGNIACASVDAQEGFGRVLAAGDFDASTLPTIWRWASRTRVTSRAMSPSTTPGW